MPRPVATTAGLQRAVAKLHAQGPSQAQRMTPHVHADVRTGRILGVHSHPGKT